MTKRTKLIVYGFVAVIIGMMAGQVVGDFINTYR